MRTVIVKTVDYLCDGCGTELNTLKGWPWYGTPQNRYCPNCAVKYGYCTPLEWTERFGNYHHATYKDGVITAYKKWGRGYRKDEFEV